MGLSLSTIQGFEKNTHQSSAVNAECRSEVRRLVEVVLEAVAQRVAVGADKIRLHLSLAYHTIPDVRRNS